MAFLRSQPQVKQRLLEIVSELDIDVGFEGLQSSGEVPPRGIGRNTDFVLIRRKGQEQRFWVETKTTGVAVRRFIASDLSRFRGLMRRSPGSEPNGTYEPLLIASFLSERQRKLCRKVGVFYIDLSGNVFLKVPGLEVLIDGRPNLYPEANAPPGLFSDKASLILRVLLADPSRPRSVRDLAREAAVSPGFVSKVFRRLIDQDYSVESLVRGMFLLREAPALVADWADSYSWKKNDIAGYYLHSDGVGDALERLRAVGRGHDFALSLQAGASLVAPHAVFSEVHAYVPDLVSRDGLARAVGAQRVDRGANLFLMVAYYKQAYRHPIFLNPDRPEDLPVVSDLQLYLDLWKYPLRGREQADFLYDRRLAPIIGPQP